MTELKYPQARDRLFGLVQRTRVDAQELLGALDEINDAMGLRDRDACEKEVAARVASAEAIIEGLELESRRERIGRVLEESDELARRVADAGRMVQNDLGTALASWPRAEHGLEIENRISEANAALEEVITVAGQLTIPGRLGEHLEALRVGRTLDFDDVFADELPDPEQRRQLLRDLDPYRVGGVVDAEEGLVFKLSRSKPFRVFTYLAPLLAVLLGAGVLIAIGNLDNLGVDLNDDWHLNNVGALLGAYVLVLAGVIIHLIVETRKQRDAGTVAVIATSDLLAWLHLRYVGISLGVVWVLVAVIGLKVAGVGSSSGEDAGLYIAAGYSVDSIAGLFLTRFDTAAGKTLRRWRRDSDDETDKKKDVEGGGGGGRRNRGRVRARPHRRRRGR